MNANQVIDAIEAGNRTTDEIADALGVHENHAGRELKKMSDDGAIFRGKPSRTFHYFTPSEVAAGEVELETLENGADDVKRAKSRMAAVDAGGDEDAVEWDADNDGRMPLSKSRTQLVDELDEPTEEVYVPHNGELDRFSAICEAREFSGTAPHCLVSGPTGCGKTTFSETTAARLGAKYVELQMSTSTKESDLLGSPSIIGGETVWVDGPVVAALEASNDGPVVINIDEVNRAKAKAKGALFSLLDHRARVVLNGGRGGEVIQGNPENLIIMGTINEGDMYTGTYEMDAAEIRRFSRKYETDYLGFGGEENVRKEAELVASKTPICEGLAKTLVDAANEVRKKAKDSTNTDIEMGVPTDAVINWAGTAYAFDAAGAFDDPVMAAAQETISKLYFDGDSTAVDEVESTLNSVAEGAPMDEEEYTEWAAEARVTCPDCSFEMSKEKAEEKGILTFFECPDCSEKLREIEV